MTFDEALAAWRSSWDVVNNASSAVGQAEAAVQAAKDAFAQAEATAAEAGVVLLNSASNGVANATIHVVIE